MNRFWINKLMIVIRAVKRIFAALLLLVAGTGVFAQDTTGIVNYLQPEDYILEAVSISGVKFLDPNALDRPSTELFHRRRRFAPPRMRHRVSFDSGSPSLSSK